MVTYIGLGRCSGLSSVCLGHSILELDGESWTILERAAVLATDIGACVSLLFQFQSCRVQFECFTVPGGSGWLLRQMGCFDVCIYYLMEERY